MDADGSIEPFASRSIITRLKEQIGSLDVHPGSWFQLDFQLRVQGTRLSLQSEDFTHRSPVRSLDLPWSSLSPGCDAVFGASPAPMLTRLLVVSEFPSPGCAATCAASSSQVLVTLPVLCVKIPPRHADLVSEVSACIRIIPFGISASSEVLILRARSPTSIEFRCIKDIHLARARSVSSHTCHVT